MEQRPELEVNYIKAPSLFVLGAENCSALNDCLLKAGLEAEHLLKGFKHVRNRSSKNVSKGLSRFEWSGVIRVKTFFETFS